MKHSLESSSGAMESLQRYRHQTSADPKMHNYNNIGTYTYMYNTTCSATQHKTYYSAMEYKTGKHTFYSVTFLPHGKYTCTCTCC